MVLDRVMVMKETVHVDLLGYTDSQETKEATTADHLAPIAASNQLALSPGPSKSNHPLLLLLNPLLLCVIGRYRAAGDENASVLVNNFEIRELALMTLQCNRQKEVFDLQTDSTTRQTGSYSVNNPSSTFGSEFLHRHLQHCRKRDRAPSQVNRGMQSTLVHLLVPLPSGGFYIVHHGILEHEAYTLLDAMET